jgi:hypothetical protein
MGDNWAASNTSTVRTKTPVTAWVNACTVPQKPLAAETLAELPNGTTRLSLPRFLDTVFSPVPARPTGHAGTVFHCFPPVDKNELASPVGRQAARGSPHKNTGVITKGT